MKDFRCEISYIDKYDDLNIISRFDVINPKFILEGIEFKSKDVQLDQTFYSCNPFKIENNFDTSETLLHSIAALEVIRGSYYSRDQLNIWTFSHNTNFYINFRELTKKENLFDEIRDKYDESVEEPIIFAHEDTVQYTPLSEIIKLHSKMIKHFCNVDDNISVDTNKWMKNAHKHNLSERILCAFIARQYEHFYREEQLND